MLHSGNAPAPLGASQPINADVSGPLGGVQDAGDAVGGCKTQVPCVIEANQVPGGRSAAIADDMELEDEPCCREGGGIPAGGMDPGASQPSLSPLFSFGRRNSIVSPAVARSVSMASAACASVIENSAGGFKSAGALLCRKWFRVPQSCP